MNFAINDYYIVYIFWNLFLLIIPFFLSLCLGELWKKTKFRRLIHIVLAIFLAFFWILFIPNTAYVVADARHLSGFCPDNKNRICVENAWMIMFFFTYAVIGWVGFVYLFNQMKTLISKIFGKRTALFFAPLGIPVISLGVMLGLIDRLNSWEVFMKPMEIIQKASTYFTDFTRFKNLFAFIVFYYILYYTGDIIFKKKILKIGRRKNNYV
ncbi:MAG: DUF1361 domain-containing protein [bacterium]